MKKKLRHFFSCFVFVTTKSDLLYRSPSTFIFFSMQAEARRTLWSSSGEMTLPRCRQCTALTFLLPPLNHALLPVLPIACRAMSSSLTLRQACAALVTWPNWLMPMQQLSMKTRISWLTLVRTSKEFPNTQYSIFMVTTWPRNSYETIFFQILRPGQ